MRDILQSAFRSKQSISLLFLDMDFFKRINDTYGHHAGDIVLKDLAKIIQNTIRKNDKAFRLGGEEFAISLKDTNEKGAKILGEKIRANIEKHKFYINSDLTLEGKTISIGAVELMHKDLILGSTHENMRDLLILLGMQADEALYYVKDHGRNQVAVFSQVVSEILKGEEKTEFYKLQNTILSKYSTNRSGSDTIFIGDLQKEEYKSIVDEFNKYYMLIKNASQKLQEKKLEKKGEKKLLQVPEDWMPKVFDKDTDQDYFKNLTNNLSKFVEKCDIVGSFQIMYDKILYKFEEKVQIGNVDDIISEIAIVFDQIFLMKYSVDSQFVCHTKKIINDLFRILVKFDSKDKHKSDYKKISFVTSTYIYEFIANLGDYQHFDVSFFEEEKWVRLKNDEKLKYWTKQVKSINLSVFVENNIKRHASLLTFDTIIEFFESNMENNVDITIFHPLIYDLINQQFEIGNKLKNTGDAFKTNVTKLRYWNYVITNMNNIHFFVTALIIFNKDVIPKNKIKEKLLLPLHGNIEKFVFYLQKMQLQHCILGGEKCNLSIKSYSTIISNLILLQSYFDFLKEYLNFDDEYSKKIKPLYTIIGNLLENIISKQTINYFNTNKNIIISDILQDCIGTEISTSILQKEIGIDFNKNSLRGFFHLSKQYQKLQKDAPNISHDNIKDEIKKIILSFYFFSKANNIKKISNIIKYGLFRQEDIDVLEPIVKENNIEKFNNNLIKHYQLSLFNKSLFNALKLLRGYLSTITETNTGRNIKFKIIIRQPESPITLNFENMGMIGDDNILYQGIKSSIDKGCIWWNTESGLKKYPLETIKNESMPGIKGYFIQMGEKKECLIIPYKYSILSGFLDNGYLLGKCKIKTHKNIELWNGALNGAKRSEMRNGIILYFCGGCAI